MSAGSFAWTNERTSCWKALSASLHCRSMCLLLEARGLQAQHRLGDDVLLDFVRAAVDRRRPTVEPVGKLRLGVVGAGRRLVAAALLAGVGVRVPAERLDAELGDLLPDLRAADLQ